MFISQTWKASGRIQKRYWQLSLKGFCSHRMGDGQIFYDIPGDYRFKEGPSIETFFDPLVFVEQYH
jgi:hypothetical protein